MSDTLARQIEELVDVVVLPLEEQGADINPVMVASQVDLLIDPDSISPDLKTYASIMQIRNITRKRLAKRHDPVEIAKDYVENDTGDLFGESLQPYYPTKRMESGERQSVYVRKENLTDMDVKRLVKTMSKAGSALLEHARALDAWHMSRAA